jgi:WD40 repeat protein
MISGSRDKTARQWDIEMGKEIKEARDVYEREVRAVGVSRDGRCIITAGGDFNIGELKACEVETGTVMIFEGHSRRITCIDISADSTLLVSGSLDGTVRIWSLETGKLVTVIFNDAENVGAVRFSQDSKKLAVKSWRPGNRLAIWDIRSPTLDVQLTKLGGGMGLTSAPVFWTMKDRTIIATFSFTDDPDYPNTIYEFDTSTLNIVGAPFQGHTLTVTSLALSHDCVLLVSASSIDNTIKLWDFESRQLLASFDILSTIYHLILSPDSRQLVYTTMRNIYVCNIPPEILANIQPVPQIRVRSYPRI